MPQPIEFTDQNFQSEVIESDRPVLVDLWAPWCGPCRALGPTIKELAEEYSETAKVGKLDVDENPETAETYDTNSIPTVLLFLNGEVIQTFVGVAPKNEYQHAINNALMANVLHKGSQK